MNDTAFRPTLGATRDDEGFRIMTGAEAMPAPGERAAVWMPGRPCATSMSVQMRNDGLATLTRDGKGDVLRFDWVEAKLGFRVPVTGTNGRIVGYLSVSERNGWESGLFTAVGGSGFQIPFTWLAQGLVELGSWYLV